MGNIVNTDKQIETINLDEEIKEDEEYLDKKHNKSNTD